MGAEDWLALSGRGNHGVDGVAQAGAHGVVAEAARRVVMDDDGVEWPLAFAMLAGLVAFLDTGERGGEPDVGLKGDVQARPGDPTVEVRAAEVPVRGGGVAFPADGRGTVRLDVGVRGGR